MPRERMEGLFKPEAPSLAGFLALTLGLARARWGQAFGQCLKHEKVSLRA